MFQLSNFFGTQVVPPLEIEERNETICRVPEKTKDGVVMVTKSLELSLNPDVLIDYEDFQLDNLIAAGISPRSIQISSDSRLGSDERIINFLDALEERELSNVKD